MTTGTVDDIIADVTKLNLDMAAALNVLNAKIDGVQQDLQSQINSIVPGAASTGIVTSPPNPTVATGAAQGTVIATVACPLLTAPTFSLVSPSGRYQLSGNQIQVGAVDIDIANGVTDSLTVKATGSDGVSSITGIVNVTVGPPGLPTVVDYNFVTNYYFGGALSDFTNTQSALHTEKWADNHLTTFQANTVRRTDLGVYLQGVSQSFIGPHSMDASSWSTAGDPGWTNVTQTDLGTDSNGFHAIRIDTGNSAFGCWSNGGLTQSVAIGDVLLIKVRAKDPPAGNTPGGIYIMYRTTGAGNAANLLASVTAGSMSGGSANLVSQDAHCQIVGQTLNADGTYDLLVAYTVQAAAAAGVFEVCVATVDQTTGHKCDFYGAQVCKGSTDRPWQATGTTTLSLPADAMGYTDPQHVLSNSTGFVCLEVQQLDHATIGTAGVSGSVAGDFLKIGSASLLKPDGPAAFKAMGGSSTPLGLGGFRGIVRLVITWDNTAGSGAGSWSAYANGGKVAAGTGAVGAGGTIALLPAITGRLRRFTGGKTTLSGADAQRMSQLWNKNFINPGTALVPGAVTSTFFDDFDVNSLQTIGSPAFPYGSGAALAAAYAPTADAVHHWKPRAHFYTSDANGNGAQQINHELQEYLDPQVATNYPVITFSGSCLNGYTNATTNLTAGQQANVANNPDTPGTKYKFVSWMVTTFGSDTGTGGGGFNQRFGIFNCRAKLPAHKGSWPAFWLYNYFDTSELDIEEYYGTTPTQNSTQIHADNFTFNGPVPPFGQHEMGYDISQDFHDWTGVWVQGTYTKYFDGEQIVTGSTGGSFDNAPKFMLLNCAVQPHPTSPFDTGDPAPDATSIATMPWVSQIDRVRVFQFGA